MKVQQASKGVDSKKVNIGSIKTPQDNKEEMLQADGKRQRTNYNRYHKKERSPERRNYHLENDNSPIISANSISGHGSLSPQRPYVLTQSMVSNDDNPQLSEKSFYSCSSQNQVEQSVITGQYEETERRASKNPKYQAESSQVYQSVLQKDDTYTKTVVFEERRQRREQVTTILQEPRLSQISNHIVHSQRHNPITQSSLPKNLQHRVTPYSQYRDLQSDVSPPDLQNCINEIIETLTVNNQDITEVDAQIDQTLAELIAQDVKPLTNSESNKHKHKVRGVVSHEAELQQLSQLISTLQTELSQVERSLSKTKHENCKQQVEVVKQLTSPDTQTVYNTRNISKQAQQFDELVGEANNRQIWISRDTHLQPSFSKMLKTLEYVTNNQDLTFQQDELDLEIEQLEQQLYQEHMIYQDIMKKNITTDHEQQALQNQLALTEQEIIDYKETYNKQIAELKEKQRCILQQQGELEQEIQSLNSGKRKNEQLVTEFSRSNQELTDFRETMTDDESLQILREIEELMSQQDTQVHPRLKGKQMQHDGFDYQFVLKAMTENEETILSSREDITKISTNNDRIQHELEQIQTQVLTNSLTETLEQLYSDDISSMKFVTGSLESQLDSLRRLQCDVETELQSSETDLQSIEQKLDSLLDELQRQDINDKLIDFRCVIKIEEQEEDIAKDCDVNKLKETLDRQKLDKQRHIESLQQDIKQCQASIQALEALQADKDNAIEELEMHAIDSRSPKSSKLIQKIQTNSIDAAMSEASKTYQSLPIKKISEGYYLFGTRKIYMKVDERLKVMVRDKEGRYQEVKEFIETYAQVEIEKLGQAYLDLNESQY